MRPVDDDRVALLGTVARRRSRVARNDAAVASARAYRIRIEAMLQVMRAREVSETSEKLRSTLGE